MEFKDSDFNSLRFDVHNITNQTDIIKTFPELRLYKEFAQPTSPLPEAQVFKYICFLYDKKSPFMSIDNFNRRKLAVAQRCGFDTKDGEYLPKYKKILSGTDEVINKMIIRFLRMQYDIKFSKMMVYIKQFYDSLETLTNITDESEKKKARENVNAFERDLEQLKDEILTGDKSVDLVTVLMEEIEVETIGIEPEEVAQKLNKGESKLGINPYE